MKFKGKVAIITGGAQGIGRAVARLFAQESATVIIGDMDEKKALETIGSIRQETGNMAVYFKLLDVTDRTSIGKLLSCGAIAVHRRVDILVNNAGILRDNLLAKMTDDEFDSVLDVNLRGVKNMTKAVVPIMIAQKSGVILNASSVVAPGNVGQTNYAASKAGIESMTVTWAGELGKYGIRVNAVAPGFTDTQMVAGIPENIKERFLKKIPLGRYAKPEEIAAAYAFLASDDASYITGSILSVNGGFRV